MSKQAKLALGVLVAVVVALAAGWLWGASGKSDLQTRARNAELRLHVTEAHGHVLEARVHLYDLNFGDASRHLEQAKLPLQRARQGLEDRRQREVAKVADEALMHIEDSQKLAGQLDQGANHRAGQAASAIRQMLGEVPPAGSPGR
jgi:hypothetical protein